VRLDERFEVVLMFLLQNMNLYFCHKEFGPTHEIHPFAPKYIRDAVSIRQYSGRSSGNAQPSKLSRNEFGIFHVYVSINEAWRYEFAMRMYFFDCGWEVVPRRDSRDMPPRNHYISWQDLSSMQ
jgi:hypothetical protein